jgi:hypothetical protein
VTQTKTATLKVPGASLYYEVTGSGPILLMIPGFATHPGPFADTVHKASAGANGADQLMLHQSQRRDARARRARQGLARPPCARRRW